MRALALFGIVAAAPVGAQVTYDYTGQTMMLTGETFEPGPGGGTMQTTTLSYAVMGDVVLSQALNPNEADQKVIPLAYAFNDPGLEPGDGSGYLNYSAKIPYGSPLTPVGPNPVPWPDAANPPGLGIPTLEFSTSGGKITSFSMTFGGVLTPYGGETLLIASTGDDYYASVATPDCGCGGSWSGSNSVGGSWAQPAPEIYPSSAVAALTLLCGAALVLNSKSRA